MSKFIKDPSANQRAAGPSSLEQAFGSEIGRGTKEINMEWINKMKGVSDDDPDLKPEQDQVDDTVNKELEKKDSPISAAVAPAMMKRKIIGSSNQENKALGEYRKEGPKTAEQVEAFLTGFRVKQDYNNVSMKAQIDQLQRLVDILTSAATSVSRASCDIVESTNSSSSKLAMTVTEYINKVKIPMKEEQSSKTVSLKSHQSESSQSAPTIEKVVESNKEEMDRIKREDKGKATVEDKGKAAIEAPVITQHLSADDFKEIMGASIIDIAGFYKVDENKIKKMLEGLPGPAGVFVARNNGINAAKGTIKRMISQLQ
ncbi:MAG: protein 2 [Xinjiang varicosavirus]|uniref:Protein 2 n=1 Tax=Xinjiang varicosavirus TaxID=3071319 RepID=A0AAJ4TY54_9RHAB|nr:MAG: protein 2 [Xinjiang varicosa-like virus]QYF49871.1 MAG: protein 2 [Xinjiang varicosa-like virus]